MGPEDQTLIRKFLDGDAESVESVAGRIRAAASPFRARLGADWDDCLQDCLTEVTRLLREQRFRGESGLGTYVWRITSNRCIDQLRRRSRAAYTILDDLALGADDRSPLRETLRKEFGEIAMRVFRESSEDCRGLWTMILEGLSYDEMSARGGVAAGTLRVRVLRCRRRAWEIREKLLGTE